MPICFWIGSHWGLRGIAFRVGFWLSDHCHRGILEDMKTIQMRVSDYFEALRPALDGSLVMIVVVLSLSGFCLHSLLGSFTDRNQRRRGRLPRYGHIATHERAQCS